jgi:hypothetical protein
MLVKTNKKAKNGKMLYQNVFSGTIATLDNHRFMPSQRRDKRHREPLIKKVHTNRKCTKGRKVYYQLIYQMREVFNKFKKRYDSNGMLLGIDRLTTKKLVLVKTIKHKVPNY